MTSARRTLRRTALPFAACLLVAACASPGSDGAAPAATPFDMEMPVPIEASEQHRWLQQLVGEWDVTCEMPAEGDEPILMLATESVRAVGDLWVQAEGSADMDGTPFTSFMTLGYDPSSGDFVGTWIDSVQTTLWIYRGWLDEAGTTLVLEAEGPTFDGSGGTTIYRDSITVETPDRKVLTSAMRNPDGTFTPFMRSVYERAR